MDTIQLGCSHCLRITPVRPLVTTSLWLLAICLFLDPTALTDTNHNKLRQWAEHELSAKYARDIQMELDNIEKLLDLVPHIAGGKEDGLDHGW